MGIIERALSPWAKAGCQTSGASSTTRPPPPPLEINFHGELNVAFTLRRSNGSQAGAKARARSIQNRCISQVDGFSAELKPFVLGDRELLHERTLLDSLVHSISLWTQLKV